MRRISFKPQFVNEAGNDLIHGKIHTIRQNYSWWKRFEGQEVELFTWEGKPYRSKQRVFCIKRVVSVQEVELNCSNLGLWFTFNGKERVSTALISRNDGFPDRQSFYMWFWNGNYKSGKIAIIHFTDFRY